MTMPQLENKRTECCSIMCFIFNLWKKGSRLNESIYNMHKFTMISSTAQRFNLNNIYAARQINAAGAHMHLQHIYIKRQPAWATSMLAQAHSVLCFSSTAFLKLSLSEIVLRTPPPPGLWSPPWPSPHPTLVKLPCITMQNIRFWCF